MKKRKSQDQKWKKEKTKSFFYFELNPIWSDTKESFLCLQALLQLYIENQGSHSEAGLTLYINNKFPFIVQRWGTCSRNVHFSDTGSWHANRYFIKLWEAVLPKRKIIHALGCRACLEEGHLSFNILNFFVMTKQCWLISSFIWREREREKKERNFLVQHTHERLAASKPKGRGKSIWEGGFKLPKKKKRKT